MVKKQKPQIVFSVGRRKEARARAKIIPGTGKITINSKPFELFGNGNEFIQLRLKEPLLLAEDLASKVDIKVNVEGGGIMGQVDAIRQAIARGLVDFFKSKELKEKFLNYDRSLLVFDYRRCEPHKPSRSKAGARRHKQRSKR